MKQLMNRNQNHGKNNQPQNCMQKNSPENKVTLNIDPHEKGNTEEKHAKSPVEVHQSRLSFKIIKHERNKIRVGDLYHLPVF